MSIIEIQIDRLVGPTHHFGGLGVGNVASQSHAGQTSNPRAAALQGLDKMRLVASQGVPQLILPPQPRPDYSFLRSLGFDQLDYSAVLQCAKNEAPYLLSAATSCSAMWTANAATVTPGVDSERTGVQVTVANLDASIHRAIEPHRTAQELQSLLGEAAQFHAPLPGGAAMRDEGAANHMRLGTGANQAGINLLVYGDEEPLPKARWPRQSRLASASVARLHGLPGKNTFFLKQHPDAIDAGAFHNDVVAMSHENLLIHHERAFSLDESEWKSIEERFFEVTGDELTRISVPAGELSIEDTVRTYLFNSQIISPAADAEDSPPVIICTSQVRDHAGARALVEQWCDAGHFAAAHYVDLNQSMSGGGGPACLRLRVPVEAQAVSQIATNALWCESLDRQLREMIKQDYVEELTIDDLANAQFHDQAGRAQKQLVELLGVA